MTCRHGPGDTSCSSHPYNVQQREAEYATERAKDKEKADRKVQEELYAKTPDSEKYEIVDVMRVGTHLVMKVLYPNCSKCSYEGNKVMVFLDVTEAQVLKWKVIDPHFREGKLDITVIGSKVSVKDAPGPAARFPASKEGWADACAYAQGKVK